MQATIETTAVRVLSAGTTLDIPQRPEDPGDGLWLTAAELHEVSGWELKPEGLCRDEVCVPLDGPRAPQIDGDLICVSRLWEQLGRPALCDTAGSTWFLGTAAEDRAQQLKTLEAPDFALPDIEGKLHRLSDYRGKKILLATWASW